MCTRAVYTCDHIVAQYVAYQISLSFKGTKLLQIAKLLNIVANY